MATLTSFETNSTWQEITNVSSVSAEFTLQNKGKNTVYIYRGETPNDEDSFIITSVFFNVDKSEVSVDLRTDTTKVWVRSNGQSRLVIDKN